MAKNNKTPNKGIDLTKTTSQVGQTQFTASSNPTPRDLSSSSKRNKDLVDVTETSFPIPMENVKFMLISFALIILGFILMSGGQEDIYSFRRITLSVLVCMGGFIFMIYAIMCNPKMKEGESGK